jgi:retron-type reverse transcriptase
MTYKTYEKLFRDKASEAGYSEDKILKCLQYSKPLIERGLPVIYNSSHIAALIGYKDSYFRRAIYSTDFFYRSFLINKKDGKKRRIKEPLPSLKEIQHWILDKILYKIEVSKFAKAYLPNRNLKDNVRFHKNQETVICLDIENFFESISLSNVVEIFIEIGYSETVASMLAKLCCLDKQLPQGAPTSPQLSNIFMRNFDKSVSQFCIKNKLRYTRYADDITISGKFDSNHIKEVIEKEVMKNGLSLNIHKTRVMHKGSRQIVTGIVVNEKVQTPKYFRREIRQEVYYIKKYGLTNHLRMINCKKANYLKHLQGKINFALHINPKDEKLLEYKKELFEIAKGTAANNGYHK